MQGFSLDGGFLIVALMGQGSAERYAIPVPTGGALGTSIIGYLAASMVTGSVESVRRLPLVVVWKLNVLALISGFDSSSSELDALVSSTFFADSSDDDAVTEIGSSPRANANAMLSIEEERMNEIPNAKT